MKKSDKGSDKVVKFKPPSLSKPADVESSIRRIDERLLHIQNQIGSLSKRMQDLERAIHLIRSIDTFREALKEWLN